jgi:hypothetical protein
VLNNVSIIALHTQKTNNDSDATHEEEKIMRMHDQTHADATEMKQTMKRSYAETKVCGKVLFQDLEKEEKKER